MNQIICAWIYRGLCWSLRIVALGAVGANTSIYRQTASLLQGAEGFTGLFPIWISEGWAWGKLRGSFRAGGAVELGRFRSYLRLALVPLSRQRGIPSEWSCSVHSGFFSLWREDVFKVKWLCFCRASTSGATDLFICLFPNKPSALERTAASA